MIIQEFLPNPVGKDNDGEYIKLFNDGREAVNLSGWKIKDASGKTYSLNGKSIIGQGELILDYAATKISLNNNGETLFLYDSSGKLVDEVGYSGSAAEGMVYGKKVELSEEIKQELFEDSNRFFIRHFFGDYRYRIDLGVVIDFYNKKA